MLGLLISTLVTLFVVLPIKLLVVAPLQLGGFLFSGGAHLFGFGMKAMGWALWVLTLPLRLL